MVPQIEFRVEDNCISIVICMPLETFCGRAHVQCSSERNLERKRDEKLNRATEEVNSLLGLL